MHCRHTILFLPQDAYNAVRSSYSYNCCLSFVPLSMLTPHFSQMTSLWVLIYEDESQSEAHWMFRLTPSMPTYNEAKAQTNAGYFRVSGPIGGLEYDLTPPDFRDWPWGSRLHEIKIADFDSAMEVRKICKVFRTQKIRNTEKHWTSQDWVMEAVATLAERGLIDGRAGIEKSAELHRHYRVEVNFA